MLGSEEEINAVEGAPLLSGLVPPPIPLGFPRGTQHSPGKGRAHRNLSLMIAIININGKTPLTEITLSSSRKEAQLPCTRHEHVRPQPSPGVYRGSLNRTGSVKVLWLLPGAYPHPGLQVPRSRLRDYPVGVLVSGICLGTMWGRKREVDLPPECDPLQPCHAACAPSPVTMPCSSRPSWPSTG